jgi:hypothetical protein
MDKLHPINFYSLQVGVVIYFFHLRAIFVKLQFTW